MYDSVHYLLADLPDVYHHTCVQACSRILGPLYPREVYRSAESDHRRGYTKRRHRHRYLMFAIADTMEIKDDNGT